MNPSAKYLSPLMSELYNHLEAQLELSDLKTCWLSPEVSELECSPSLSLGSCSSTSSIVELEASSAVTGNLNEREASAGSNSAEDLSALPSTSAFSGSTFDQFQAAFHPLENLSAHFLNTENILSPAAQMEKFCNYVQVKSTVRDRDTGNIPQYEFTGSSVINHPNTFTGRETGPNEFTRHLNASIINQSHGLETAEINIRAYARKTTQISNLDYGQLNPPLLNYHQNDGFNSDHTIKSLTRPQENSLNTGMMLSENQFQNPTLLNSYQSHFFNEPKQETNQEAAHFQYHCSADSYQPQLFNRLQKDTIQEVNQTQSHQSDLSMLSNHRQIYPQEPLRHESNFDIPPSPPPEIHPTPPKDIRRMLKAVQARQKGEVSGAEKKKLRELARNLVCTNCCTSNSPLWRRTADKKGHLCNSCGCNSCFRLTILVYFKQYKAHRPLELVRKPRKSSKSPNMTSLVKTLADLTDHSLRGVEDAVGSGVSMKS